MALYKGEIQVKIKNTIKKNENAVSPVISVILMVAITVILAAVLATFVFGMNKPQNTANDNNTDTEVEVKNPNIHYYPAGSGGQLYIEGNSPKEVVQIIAQLELNGCKFEQKVSITKDPNNNKFYTYGPSNICKVNNT